ncbi:hypothetical protein BC332_34795 [Capsicum chinense]|nr:hypothetical protein BC332_34795 [Capsicum chinense]
MHQLEFLEDLTTLRKGDLTMSDYVSKLMDLNRKVKKAGIEFEGHALSLFLLRSLPKDRNEQWKWKAKRTKLQQWQPSGIQAERRSSGTVNQIRRRRADLDRLASSLNPKVSECINALRVVNSGMFPVNVLSSKNFSPKKPEKIPVVIQQKVQKVSEVLEVVNNARAYCSVGTINKGKKKRRWYLDSGASDHMSPLREDFVEFSDKVSGVITMGNGEEAVIQGKGKVIIKTLKEDGWLIVSLSNALHVPELECGLIAEEGASLHHQYLK